MKLGEYLTSRGWTMVPVEKPKGAGKHDPPHNKWSKNGITLSADEAKLQEWREDWQRMKKESRYDT